MRDFEATLRRQPGVFKDHVAGHELQHLFAAAVAAVPLGVTIYNTILMRIRASAAGGEFEEFTLGGGEILQVVQSVSALGPLARLGDPREIVAVLRRGNPDEIQRKGLLSDGDMDVAGLRDGSSGLKTYPLACPAICGAVRLADMLPKFGMTRMKGEVLRLTEVQSDDDYAYCPHKLKDWVPYPMAKRAADLGAQDARKWMT